MSVIDEEHFTQGWHLDKRVSLVHIVTTVSALVAVMMWLTAQEKRITINEIRIADAEISNKRSLVELKDQSSAQYQEIIRRLERLDDTRGSH